MGRSSNRARAAKRKAAAKIAAEAKPAKSATKAKSTTKAKSNTKTKKTKTTKKTKKLTAAQKKMIGLKKVRVEINKKKLSAGGKGRMGAVANPGEGSMRKSKELRTTRAGKKHKSTKVLEKAKGNHPGLNVKAARMQNADFESIGSHSNPNVAALVLRSHLYTVVGVDDATLNGIAKEWLNALYDKESAARMAKMPRIWLLHKLGVAIDNYKNFYGVKAWNKLAE